MTPEEIRAKLENLGVPTDGQWRETAGKTVPPPFLREQKKLLTELGGLIENQIAADQQQVADLHLALERLKHGGGTGNG